MKEESRIEALEHELKILKNEIQSTLLEIREQILNHYYPELRAEEPLRSLSLPVRPPVGRPGVPAKTSPRAQESSNSLSEIEAKGQIQPFSDIFLEDLEEDDESKEESSNLVNSRRPAILDVDDDDFEDDDSEDDSDGNDDVTPAINEGKVRKVVAAPRANLGVTPQTREVDFRQLKQAAGGPKVKPLTTTQVKVESDAPKAKRPNFGALAMWVNDAVTKVGKEQTLDIIETYAKGGKLSDETKSSMVQLLSMTGDEEPATPAGTQEMLGLMVGLDQILA